jgi:hypothetical protein
VETPGIEAPTGTDGNLFPAGGTESITNEGLPTGQTAPIGSTVTPVQAEETVQTEDPVVKEDPGRMEYWQSQADKAKNDSFQLQQELEYYKNTMGPIAKVIEQNPQVLNNIENIQNGHPSQQPVQAGQQQGNSLNKPVRPQKPNSYSEVDAYNDPESDSFKHRVATDQWRDNMLGWYENVDTARQQHQQRVAQEQQKNQMVNNAHSYAMNQYGFDVNKAADFVRWAQNPSNITVDSLVQLYAQKDAPSQQQAQTQNRTAEMQAQAERLKVPRPTVVQTGESAPTLTEEDQFNMGLLANKRR